MAVDNLYLILMNTGVDNKIFLNEYIISMKSNI